jgi:hypothetical protein
MGKEGEANHEHHKHNPWKRRCGGMPVGYSGQGRSPVACRPTAIQQPQNKQLYKSCFYITAPPTDMNATISGQQWHYNKEAVFYVVHAKIL